MTEILLFILLMSVFVPIYTYVIYPILLKIFPEKIYKKEIYEPTVSIIMWEKCSEEKIRNLWEQDYPGEKIEILTKGCLRGQIQGECEKVNAMISVAQGEVILFTDGGSILERHAVKRLMSNFADSRIGIVCGRVCKENGEKSAYWKYENWVKRQESKIGRLSGANQSLFAVRKEAIKEIPEGVINTNFFLSTAALRSGWDSVLEENATAYECFDDGEDRAFKRHVIEGAGYYQALSIFRRMLFPCRGSFTYISHRVLKWLTPWNMIAVFISSALLADNFIWTGLLFAGQIIIYMFLGLYIVSTKKHKKRVTGIVGRLMSLLFYFVALNISYVVGFYMLWFKKGIGRYD